MFKLEKNWISKKIGFCVKTYTYHNFIIEVTIDMTGKMVPVIEVKNKKFPEISITKMRDETSLLHMNFFITGKEDELLDFAREIEDAKEVMHILNENYQELISVD